MRETIKIDQAQTCPQCDNHCPIDAIKCGRGRKYFGMVDNGSNAEGRCAHSQCRPRGGLASLLHQCGRFVRHTELKEDDLFQSLTSEEKTALQNLLEKLAADWRERCGEEGFDLGCHDQRHGHSGEKHLPKQESHNK